MPRITASTGVLAAIAVAVVIAIAVLDRAGTPGTQQAGAPEIQQVGEVPAIGPLPAKKAPKASMVEMGKRLFFDARISGDGAVSCAFCHDPAQGFGKSTDKNGKPQRLSEAYPGTNHFRNAPTLVNTTYKEDFASVGWAWDGHMGANLNDVMRNEITETAIMNMDMRIMHERMKQDPVYVKMCQENFGGECSSGKARKALVAFLKTLVSKDAPFDTGKMSDAAQRGQALFEGKAKCIQCHNGPYLSDGTPHNTGVAEDLEIFRDPVRHITYRSILHNHGVPNMGIWRRDVGYFLVSKDYADVGKFITPTLRELKYTAPYMHNGMIATLGDVVDFYNGGGGKDDPLATELQPLGLGDQEKKDLVAFLESLSSSTPVTVKVENVPQKYKPIKDWLNVHN
ncbi:MAG: photosynthetic protein synthase I [Alphaproteobacteria bacterium]|nr:photosynthetic protein synthase I [Alphaproteobacteria bacterium]